MTCLHFEAEGAFYRKKKSWCLHQGAAAFFVLFLFVFVPPGSFFFFFFIEMHIYDDSSTILIDGVA